MALRHYDMATYSFSNRCPSSECLYWWNCQDVEIIRSNLAMTFLNFQRFSHLRILTWIILLQIIKLMN